MRTNRRSRIIIGVILLAVIIALGSWYYLRTTAAANGAVIASGTIETTQVRISPEVSGIVMEISITEGQEVQAGQVLAKINDATAKVQYSQVQAALQSAQESLALAMSNYDLVAANSAPDQRQVAISAAQMDVVNASQALQAVYDNASVNAAQLSDTIASLDKQRDKAQQFLDSIKTQADQADIDAAWASVVIAQDKLENARDDFQPYENKDQSNLTRAILQARLAAAQKQYDSMVQRYNNLVGSANPYQLAQAKSDLSLLESRLADARRQYDKLVDGVDPDTLELAKARLTTAQAKLASLQTDISDKQLAVAQDQVDVAQAQVANVTEQLKSLEIQLGKYTITAPISGVILSQGVEVGETTAPGAVLFEIGELKQLQLTVYLPEEKFGLVKYGDHASVAVDAYPGRTFTAVVDRLANQAEFTPRNVQTVEGRRDTVFALYLSLDNSDLALLPGMWADVTFNLK
jgi:HlyD family secretion protein